MSSITIKFADSSKEGSSLRIVPDYERGGNKSVYSIGEESYVRIYPSGLRPAITVAGGSWKYEAEGLMESFSEHLAFADESSSRLKFPAVKLVSIGKISGLTPHVRGDLVGFSNKVLGSVQIDYETSYDLVEVTGFNTGRVILKADDGDGVRYLELDYTGEETDTSERAVLLTARDAASREVIPYAQVFINGTFRGVTDGGGLLNLGRLKKGTYSLFVRKDGYLDTDKDYLRNDSFRVE
jgi:hypothetical protein